MNSAEISTKWNYVKLGDICKTTSGGTPSRNHIKYYQGAIPWVKSGELKDGPVTEIEEYITDEAVKNSSAKVFPKGTLLIALYGATVGRLGILTRNAATNQAVCGIFPPEEINIKYLFWYLRSRRSDLVSLSIGGAQPNISQGIVRDVMIPVAPLSQQKLIVSEIEKQFSRLDEAVAALKRVRASLKRYKASVLKAAVEGKLTEEWREQNPDVEPAEKLLKRILAERKKKWEEKNPGKKYKEPTAPDTSNLPKLPEGWVWACTEQLTWYITSGSMDWKKYYCDKGAIFIRTQDINKNRLDLNEVAYVDLPSKAEGKRSLVELNDILVIITGANVGKVALIEKNLPEAYVSQSVGLMKFSNKNIIRYIHLAMIAEGAGKLQLEKMVYGMGRPVLSLENLRDIIIPLPSEKEQQEIVAKVEERLSVLIEIEAELETNLKRAERLRQAILKKAFSGRLVASCS